MFTAAAQIEAAGGRALPVVGDIRDEDQVAAAVAQAAGRFGGIDVCVNNASAINLSGTEALAVKRYDLMQSINTRGTFRGQPSLRPAPETFGEPAHPDPVLLGGEAAMRGGRRPELHADAAYAVITKSSRDCTGNAFLCEDVLTAEGVTDFDRYAYSPGAEPEVDLFVDHA